MGCTGGGGAVLSLVFPFVQYAQVFEDLCCFRRRGGIGSLFRGLTATSARVACWLPWVVYGRT